MKKLKQTKGITLVALVITIIILLILAGISISALTNQGLFTQAQNAKNLTEEKTAEENEILTNYLEQMNAIIGGQIPEPPKDPSLPTNPATTIAEAQSEYMLTKTVNSPIQDAYGNRITVPAGFKIKVDDTTNNATTVDKGIVIIDSNENEFVWIPTGKIYTDANKTEANAKTIELNRYEFDISGTPTAKGSATIVHSYNSSYTCQELATSTKGNTTAKDINDFKTKASAIGSGGFYIGRYEARTGTGRSAPENALTTVTTKASDYVYNYVTQPQAANLSRNMYQNATTYTSDLVNSYAWDTAILFLQTFGDNKTYSRKNSVNTSLASTGTNNQTAKDVQCNVYDMASNIVELSTETCSYSSNPCVSRGGIYYYSYYYANYRNDVTTSGSGNMHGFRPILYIDV